MSAEKRGRSVSQRRADRRCGQSLLETSILAPMMLFLFLGMVDSWFYVYSFIMVSNAARAAAQFTATGGGLSQRLACQVALREMKTMANIAALNPATYDCTTIAPLQVNVAEYTDTFGTKASRVTLKYKTMLLFQLPFMPGQMEIDRVAIMRKMPLGT